MIKAIIFDFFGVICSDEYWRFVKEDESMSGQFHQLADSVNLGQISWPDFLQKVATGTGRPVEEVKKMYASERIHPELVAYIDNLHQKKYKTALLTNASAEFIEPLLDKAGLKSIFDEVIISSKIGIIKPDPRIYEYVLEKLGVKAKDAVFVDDTQKRIDGAKSLGMNTILYRDFGQMKAELEKILTGSNN